MKRNINSNTRGIESNRLLIKDYLHEKEKIEITESINYKLKMSEHKLTCPLCHSNIENNFNEINKPDSKKAFKVILKDIDTKISMINRVIDTSRQSIEAKNKEVDYLVRKKQILSMAAEEFSKDVKTPLLPELNSINMTINNLEKDKEILLESERVYKKIDELNNRIEAAEDKLQSLNDRLRSFDANKAKKSLVLQDLNKKYMQNMRTMKYSNLSQTYIDDKSYMPFYRDASVFSHDSGGLLECMQFSYIDAIISSEFAKKHPKVLMLDSISKYFGTLHQTDVTKEELINDPEVYENIFDLLVNLSRKSQIIIVENTPPSKMDQYVKYTFRNGKRGFIDLDKNEIDVSILEVE